MEIHLPLYKIKYSLALPDLMMSQPRHHTVLFIPLSASTSSSGTVHHVIGDLVSGMKYDSRPEPLPEDNDMFFSRELIGYVAKDDYPDKFEDVLRDVEARPKQRAFNVRTMRTEQIKSNGSFNEQGEERERMWNCTEWVEERAIPRLWDVGMLKVVVDGEK
ncbi:hypothetical protein N431DRAFT_489301 [Stipitochalara longipes BDJ]|nr:hypothetical protein N431DRAFT_489301 [Stipitochalara longipes BDJ]